MPKYVEPDVRSHERSVLGREGSWIRRDLQESMLEPVTTCLREAWCNGKQNLFHFSGISHNPSAHCLPRLCRCSLLRCKRLQGFCSFVFKQKNILP